MPQPSPSPQEVHLEILNGIFYITRAGCSWRMLPHDPPHPKTVYHPFRLWHKNGLLQRIHDPLREKTRVGAGRLPEPSAGILEGHTLFHSILLS